MIWKSLDRYCHLGLLVLRIGIGLDFIILHGWGKITGGPEKWQKYGETLAKMSIEFAPTFWGFMAAFSETFAALLLMLGFLFRPATILLFITMFVAINHHLLGGDGWGVASHALKSAILFLSLIAIGPGKYSLDELFSKHSVTEPELN